MRIAAIVESIVDGPGFRASIFFQGCRLNCYNCHNKELWDFNGGFERTVEEVIEELRSYRFLDGISILGGEAMHQSLELAELCQAIKETYGYHIMLFSGYKYEEILSGIEPYGAVVLPFIDILVDGRYDDTKRDISEKNIYRGSTNQRIIDVKKSLKENRTCIYDYDNYGKLKIVR